MRAAARAYMHSLERRPMLTKSSTSFAAFSITDLLAQRRERRAGRRVRALYRRTFRIRDQPNHGRTLDEQEKKRGKRSWRKGEE